MFSFEKLYTKFGEATSIRSFSKISQLCISLDQQSEILLSLFLFLLYVQVKDYQDLLKLKC